MRNSIIRRGITVRILIIALLMVLGGLAAPAQAEKVLYGFCPNGDCSTGDGPQGLLLSDTKGNLYGVTRGGGANGEGVAYVLEHRNGNWTNQVLYDFCAQKRCADGSAPSTPLIADSQGNLYGATRTGGQYGGGALFELSPPAKGQTAWTEKILYSFCARSACADGSQPSYRLTYAGAAAGAPYDGSSPIYGVTIDGGNDMKGGTVYSLTPKKNGWSEKAIYAFCSAASCTDGKSPSGGPLLDSAGNLYGVTYSGGASDYGVLYRLTGSNYQVAHDFCAGCSEGGEPVGALATDAAGSLYGATIVGGVCSAACGTLFKFDPGASQYTVLYAFCQKNHCRDGNTPNGDVALDGSGNVYGTTSRGGSIWNNCADIYGGGGMAYRFAGSTLTVLHSFCGWGDGIFPDAGMTLSKSGNLFGTTPHSGSDAAVIYQLSPMK